MSGKSRLFRRSADAHVVSRNVFVQAGILRAEFASLRELLMQGSTTFSRPNWFGHLLAPCLPGVRIDSAVVHSARPLASYANL